MQFLPLEAGGNPTDESYFAVLSCGNAYYTIQGGSNFRVWINSKYYCDHSNESNGAELSCGTVYYAV